MSSTFGTLFRVTNFGESYGPAIGCVRIDGCPPGMALSEADIQPELDRRRPGTSRRDAEESSLDGVQILSGVYEGLTTGTPICLLILQHGPAPAARTTATSSTPPSGARRLQLLAQVRPARPRGGGRARRGSPRHGGAGAVARKWLRAPRHRISRLHDALGRDRDSVRGLGACSGQPLLRRQREPDPRARGGDGRAAQGGRLGRRASSSRRPTSRRGWASRSPTSSTPRSPTR